VLGLQSAFTERCGDPRLGRRPLRIRDDRHDAPAVQFAPECRAALRVPRDADRREELGRRAVRVDRRDETLPGAPAGDRVARNADRHGLGDLAGREALNEAPAVRQSLGRDLVEIRPARVAGRERDVLKPAGDGAHVALAGGWWGGIEGGSYARRSPSESIAI